MTKDCSNYLKLKMINEKEIKEIVLRDKETRLSISRVPKKTRAEFIEFANDEFEKDYGMCLKHIWDNFKLWKIFFQNMDYKLNDILEKVSQIEQNEKSPEERDSITMLSGRKVEKGGKK